MRFGDHNATTLQNNLFLKKKELAAQIKGWTRLSVHCIVKKRTTENGTTVMPKMQKGATWCQEKNKIGTQNRLLAAGALVCEQGYVEGNNTDYPEAVGGLPQSMSMRHWFPFYV